MTNQGKSIVTTLVKVRQCDVCQKMGCIDNETHCSQCGVATDPTQRELESYQKRLGLTHITGITVPLVFLTLLVLECSLSACYAGAVMAFLLNWGRYEELLQRLRRKS